MTTPDERPFVSGRVNPFHVQPRRQYEIYTMPRRQRRDPLTTPNGIFPVCADGPGDRVFPESSIGGADAREDRVYESDALAKPQITTVETRGREHHVSPTGASLLFQSGPATATSKSTGYAGRSDPLRLTDHPGGTGLGVVVHASGSTDQNLLRRC